MKKKWILIGCLGIFMMISTELFAYGACPTKRTCTKVSYAEPRGCPSREPLCQCTDPACEKSNDCLTRSECCEAFGNIGAR